MWENVLTQSNFLLDALRTIAWGLLLMLGELTKLAEKFLQQTYKLFDVIGRLGITQLIGNKDKTFLISALFVASLSAIGIALMLQGRKRSQGLMNNIIVAIVIIVALPTAISTFTGLFTNYKIQTTAETDKEKTSNISNIIIDNIVDFKYIDSVGFDKFTVDGNTVTGQNEQKTSKVTEGKYSLVFPNEVLDKDTKKEIKNADILYSHSSLDSNGNVKKEEIKSNTFFDFLTPWHYRYKINFIPAYISLIALAVVYFFTGMKLISVILELAFTQTFTLLLAPADIGGGQRTKKALENIVALLATVAFTVILLNMFLLFSAYLNTLEINLLFKALFLVGGARFVVDGPNIVVKILGVDAGVQSGFHAMAGTAMALKSAGGAIAGIGKGAYKAGSAIRETLSGTSSDSDSEKLFESSDDKSTLQDEKLKDESADIGKDKDSSTHNETQKDGSQSKTQQERDSALFADTSSNTSDVSNEILGDNTSLDSTEPPLYAGNSDDNEMPGSTEKESKESVLTNMNERTDGGQTANHTNSASVSGQSPTQTSKITENQSATTTSGTTGGIKETQTRASTISSSTKSSVDGKSPLQSSKIQDATTAQRATSTGKAPIQSSKVTEYQGQTGLSPENRDKKQSGIAPEIKDGKKEPTKKFNVFEINLKGNERTGKDE